MASFTDRLSSTEKDEITFSLIKFLVACNISFNTVSSEFFLGFLNKLRPAYAAVLPCRQTFSRVWLPTLYTKVKTEVVAKFGTSKYFRTLGVDG